MPLTLDDKLIAIGIRIAVAGGSRVAVRGGPETDIERTLLEGARRIPEDGRLASLLFTWVKVHGAYVVVEKLGRLARTDEPAWLRALAAWAVECGHRKWGKLARRSRDTIHLFPKEVTESAIALKGAVPWLARINVRVPEGALRIRESDVLSPAELIQRNRQYRNRYLYGPSWRADIITAIEEGLKTPAEIARQLGCSYEPAHRVVREISLARNG